MQILCDTGILLRTIDTADSQRYAVTQAVLRLANDGHWLFYTPQNLREFWNVATRPTEKNGLGMSTIDADYAARSIEENLVLLDDGPEIHREWRRIVVQHDVKGIQVHDARLVAAMRSVACRHILSLNGRDFARYSDIIALSPQDVLQGRTFGSQH